MLFFTGLRITLIISDIEFFVLVEEFETLKQMDDYEAKNVLTNEQRRVSFERRMQFFSVFINIRRRTSG